MQYFFYSLLTTHEFVRYGAVGVLNTLLSIAVFNALIFSSGITQGSWVTVFYVVSFVASVVHGFIWSKVWVFKNVEAKVPQQLASFAAVTTATALLGTGIVHVLVVVVGPPVFITPAVWANMALLATIPFNLLCNFFGVKFLVFRRKDTTPVL